MLAVFSGSLNNKQTILISCNVTENANQQQLKQLHTHK